MKRFATSLILAACLGGMSSAQLSVTASQEPSTPGTQIFFIAEATIPAQLRAECIFEIRSGSPTGPIVKTAGLCSFLRPIVGPGMPFGGASRIFGWDGNDSNQNPAPLGQYFVQIQWRAPNSTGPYNTHWLPIRIDPVAGPTPPVVSASGAFARGAATAVRITGKPGDTYALFASFTTNTGFMTPLGHVALDVDPLFAISQLNVAPFTGLRGTMGAAGVGIGGITVPNISVLQGQNIAFQGVTISGSTVALSNALSGTIQ